MFPLGTVHFPHALLPLRVFEPRYRALTADCLERDREFGVVLIERGSEVGGGDVRTSVGTVTTIVEAVVTDDGLIHLATVGTRRIRVDHWLTDDPYPRADIIDLDGPAALGPPAELLGPAEREVRRALALWAELSEGGPPHDVPVDAEPGRAMFQLAALAPLGAFDKQRLLETSDPELFVRRLTALASDAADLLALRLAGS
jgi:Lon protease-like protein